MTNYRNKYKQYYGIDFGKQYIVHHIDEDRNNNDIDNLLLLPNVLHSKYHQYKRELEMNFYKFQYLDLTEISMLSLGHGYDALTKFMKITKECEKWVIYKQQLDYKIKEI